MAIWKFWNQSETTLKDQGELNFIVVGNLWLPHETHLCIKVKWIDSIDFYVILYLL